MNVTKVKKLCACRSMKGNERCRFFRGQPPLQPGFKSDPKDASFLPGGDAEEIDPVEKVPTFKELGAHQVYMVEGEDVLPNETAIFGMMNGAPVCWLVQSDEFIQGSEAIKRVFKEHYIADKDPAPSIARLVAAMQAIGGNFSDLKLALAYDDGTGLQIEGNNGELMTLIREAEEARKDAN